MHIWWYNYLFLGPNLNSQEDKSSSERETYQDIAEVTSLVSSVVIENDNNIVLDFSSKMEDDDLEDTTSCTATPVTARSDASSNSLLSKVIKVLYLLLTNLCIYATTKYWKMYLSKRILWCLLFSAILS